MLESADETEVGVRQSLRSVDEAIIEESIGTGVIHKGFEAGACGC